MNWVLFNYKIVLPIAQQIGLLPLTLCTTFLATCRRRLMLRGGGGVPGATGVLIDANTANISTLTTNLAATGAKVTAELVGVSGSVSTNSSNISTLTTNLAATGAKVTAELVGVSGSVSTNASNISTNTSNISTLTTNVAATGAKVTAELVGVSGSVSTNSSNISTLTTNLAATGAKVTAELVGVSGSVSTNASNISTNTSNISTLTTNVAATGAKVTAELVGVSGSVSTNASNISTNTSNISTLTTNVAATGAKVTAELVGVSGSVSTNASNIATNTTNIASTGAKVTVELVGVSGSVNTNATNIANKGPKDATYVTLTTNGTLTAERTLAGGAGLSLSDAGAGGAATLAVTGIDNSMIPTSANITENKLASDVNLDAITDNGATTTNSISVNMITSSGVRTPVASGAGSTSPSAFDLSTCSMFTYTLNASAATTLSVSNPTNGQKFIVRLTNGGSSTVNWWSAIRWAGGSAPTLTSTITKVDTIGFIYTAHGNYEGFVIGQNS